MNKQRSSQLDACLRPLSSRELEHRLGEPSRFTKMNSFDRERGAYLSPSPLARRHIALSVNTRYVAVPAHYHDYLEIAYLYSGNCIERVNGKEVSLTTGDLIMIDTNTIHEIGHTEANDLLINIIVDKDFFSQSLLSRLYGSKLLSTFVTHVFDETSHKASHLVFATKGCDRFESFMFELLYASFIEKREDQGLVSMLFTLLLNELDPLLDLERSANDLSKTSTLVMQALRYLGAHYTEASLEDTAHDLHVNASYLTTALRQETGKSFKQVVTQLRMEQAAQQLAHTDATVEDIARDCGYLSPTSFYRAFKNWYGCSPAQWRDAVGGA